MKDGWRGIGAKEYDYESGSVEGEINEYARRHGRGGRGVVGFGLVDLISPDPGKSDGGRCDADAG